MISPSRTPTALACLVIALLLGTSGAAPNANVTVWVDGKQIAPASQAADTALQPIIVSGHLLMPVRFLNENLRVHAWWDRAWGIIHVGDDVHLKVGAKEAHRPAPVVGGHVLERIPLPVAPQIAQGRVYVPLEATLELLGYQVQWDRQTRSVQIRTPRRSGRSSRPFDGSR